MTKGIFAVLAVLSAAGCASSSGVVPMGRDTYMISREGATGFAGFGTLKVDAIREASDYCSKNGREIQIINTTQAKPALSYPHAEIQFMCLKPGDPELSRPKMVPTADSVIEIRK